MKNDFTADIQTILEKCRKLNNIKPEALPDLDLYMDQVTTFMDSHLSFGKRHESDKILTKTMINNYAKNQLIPPPEKKRYSREHILLLVFIYYFKSILSIDDIKTLLNPISDRYFGSKGDQNLNSIYNEIFSVQDLEIELLSESLLKQTQIADDSFPDASEEDQVFLRRFFLICQLALDVYIKKATIEHMIDQMRREQDGKTAKSPKNPGKKNK